MRHFAILTLFSAVLIGCSGEAPKEAAADEINAAVEKKFSAIDNDPSMTPEQKEEMKKHLGGPAKTGSNERPR